MDISPAGKVNFTSVVPLRVFIDGKPSTDVSNIKRAVVLTSKILTTPLKENPKSLSIIKKFKSVDRDFSFPDGLSKMGMLIRNSVKQGAAYLFTGEHAKVLNELGKKIGPAKSQGLAEFKTTNTFEVQVLAKKYFDKISEFLSYPKIRIRESINPKTRMYEGAPLELNIHASSQGEMGKPGFNLNIEDISFSKVNIS